MSTSSKKSFFDIEPRERIWSGLKKSAKKEDDETILNIPKIPQTKEERDKYRLERNRRMERRREEAKIKMKEMIENPQHYMSEKAELMSDEDIDALIEEIKKKDPKLEKEQHRWLWNNNRVNDRNSYNPYNLNHLADPGQYYSAWAQAYRMLGAFIICEHEVYGYYDNHDNDNNQACSRWIMWAAYVDPNYQGNGRNEYFGYSKNSKNYNYYGNGCQRGDDGSYHCYSSNVNSNNRNNDYYYYDQGKYSEPVGKLDCHSSDTDWKLMGIYRQEFYEFFEQITKHMWYIYDYEYTVAYAGLDYLNDGECKNIGIDYYGYDVYAAPRPLEGGSFEMGLYSDWQCLEEYYGEKNYDEFIGNYYANTADWEDDDYNKRTNAKARTQEYTMTLFNEVFEEFKYCTLCIDYPSYQDGYFNGDYGTDEDDLINQCWKFYSHDSYHCNYECLSLADAQGTINQVKYGNKYYGSSSVDQSNRKSSSSSSRGVIYNGPSSNEIARANTFFLFNFLLLGLTYYVYQQIGKHRGFDDYGGKKPHDFKNRKRRRKKTRGGLLYNNKEYDQREEDSSKNDTPWLGQLKNIVAEGSRMINDSRNSSKNARDMNDNRYENMSLPSKHFQGSSPPTHLKSKVTGKSRPRNDQMKKKGRHSNRNNGTTAFFMGSKRVKSNFKYDPPKINKIAVKGKKKVINTKGENKTTRVVKVSERPQKEDPFAKKNAKKAVIHPNSNENIKKSHNKSNNEDKDMANHSDDLKSVSNDQTYYKSSSDDFEGHGGSTVNSTIYEDNQMQSERIDSYSDDDYSIDETVEERFPENAVIGQSDHIESNKVLKGVYGQKNGHLLKKQAKNTGIIGWSKNMKIENNFKGTRINNGRISDKDSPMAAIGGESQYQELRAQPEEIHQSKSKKSHVGENMATTKGIYSSGEKRNFFNINPRSVPNDRNKVEERNDNTTSNGIERNTMKERIPSSAVAEKILERHRNTYNAKKNMSLLQSSSPG